MPTWSLSSRGYAVFVLSAAVAGCGEPDPPRAELDVTSRGDVGVESFALRSELPICNAARRASVYSPRRQ